VRKRVGEKQGEWRKKESKECRRNRKTKKQSKNKGMRNRRDDSE
jgi:hypothetical protein